MLKFRLNEILELYRIAMDIHFGIIVLIINVLTTASAIWGMQCKQMKFVITGQLVSNILLGVQYVLQDALSAAITLPPALALSLISLILTEKGKDAPRWLIGGFIAIFAGVVFLPMLINGEVFSAKMLISNVLMFAALCFFVLSITSKKSYRARICSATNCLLWLIYDIMNAPTTVLTHGILLAFIVIGMIRLDREEWKRMLGISPRAALEERPSEDEFDGSDKKV